jgi:hypothetical protein
VLKPRVEGQVFVTQTQGRIFLLKLSQEEDIVTSHLQDLDPKLKPKNTLENKGEILK